MRGASKSLGLIRRSAVPALALIVVGTFAGHAIAGPNGILAWGGYHRALQQRQAELAQLEQERAQLRHRSATARSAQGRPRHGRRAGAQGLGLVRPDEVIVPLELSALVAAVAGSASYRPARPITGERCRGAFRQENRRSRNRAKRPRSRARRSRSATRRRRTSCSSSTARCCSSAASRSARDSSTGSG